MDKKNCGNCLFWHWFGKEEDDCEYGTCCRNPPMIASKSALHEWFGEDDVPYRGINGLFPVTPSVVWCGEWKEEV